MYVRWIQLFTIIRKKTLAVIDYLQGAVIQFHRFGALIV